MNNAAEPRRPEDDGGTIVGNGGGFVKTLFPNFGFIRTDSGDDLFFMPTSVDREFGNFKALKESDRVTFEIVNHRRGLRAQKVQRQAPDA